jgi:molecular chaperone DnaJ
LERKKVKKKVQIPAGVDVGHTDPLEWGRGAGRERRSASGSLFLVLDVKPHKFFKRRDQDVILES